MRSNLYYNKNPILKKKQEEEQYMNILSIETGIKISKTYIDKVSNTLGVNRSYPLSAKLLKYT